MIPADSSGNSIRSKQKSSETVSFEISEDGPGTIMQK